MKRILTIILALFAIAGIQAQQTLINETFSGSWPPSGWSISSQLSNWSAVNSSNAGGTAPEARLSWSPQFNGETRLVSPEISMAGINPSMLVFSFKHMVNHYGGSYQIGVMARANQGAWVNLWSQTVTGSIAAHTKAIQITDPNLLNSNSLQLAFFFSGNSYNINFWYIDDVVLAVPPAFDLEVSSLNVPAYSLDAFLVRGTLTNKGLQTINSFDINWQIDDGPVNTRAYSGLSLGLLQAYNFQSQTSIELEPGSYNLKVFVSNVNGQTNDDVSENDELNQVVNVPFHTVAKLPLFESFTSSTCPPCYTFNNNFFNNFTLQNRENLTLVKYQMNWPGAGDPYYNADGGLRRFYYGVSGVPSLFVDGKVVATDATAVNNAFQAALAKPAFLDIDGLFTTVGNQIGASGSINPHSNFSDFKLHISVIEALTTGNVGTNGETSFKHVMHKMLPNGNGQTISLTAFEDYEFSYSFDMTGTHVEEMSDLMVVVFFQDNKTKEVFQSAYFSRINSPIAFFNIENGKSDIDVYPQITITYSSPVQFSDGTEINSENAHEAISFEEYLTENGEVDYTVMINEAKTQFTIQVLGRLGFATRHKVKTLDLQDMQGNQSLSYVLYFTTRNSAGEPLVTFDIEEDTQGVPLDHTFLVSFNQAIRHIDESEVTSENAAELINFTIEGPEGEPVLFDATINDQKTQISITTDGLVCLTSYFLKVLPVLGVDDEISNEKSIFFFTEGSEPVVTANIENGTENVVLIPIIEIDFDMPVSMPDGTQITHENLDQVIHFSKTDADGAIVAFSGSINAEKTKITLQPNENLEEEQLYYLEVAPLIGDCINASSEPFVVTFTTLSTVDVGLTAMPKILAYPNPASTVLFVSNEVENYTELRILDMRGALMVFKSGTAQSFEMDVSMLPAGVYFLEIKTSAGRIMKKISIIR